MTGSPRVCGAIFCLICSFLLNTSISFAQFLYLDTDGDGLSTEADILNAQPNPTVIRVYLDTTRNGDGSPAFCSTPPESLDMFSYEFTLHATNGTVRYDSYSNSMLSMGAPFGEHSDDHDYYVGFGGQASNAPGLYLLGNLTL